MEPIAITGIGCRLPGESNGPSAFWANLLAGRDLISETPADRWSLSAYHAADPSAPGRTYTRWGGFVAHPADFDAGFFGISPREALRVDPQQRWLLETTWEALEDAGYPPQDLAGTDVGVYVGISGSDYGDIQKLSRFEVDAYTNSGSALSIAANRISYLLDFRGPSVAVDTACSSSLVALDLACRALARGEVSIAIVGGANALFTPDLTIGFSKAGMLAADGRCKAFDAAANGYVRAEGAACVVLRPLARAVAAGDRVYAVIRSTYVNQDGRTGGMTVPSLDQQVRLLQEAYRLAGIDPARVGYVEAHGTGTPVGDPIEATALGRVLGCAPRRDSPLWIGSVKSNLGHLEPASGITGLAKLALILHHRTIPASLHFRAPNPHIPFAELRLAVPTAPLVWGACGDDETLCGGVNSFGFGGTNAHAVLTSAPPTQSEPPSSVAAPLYLWTVSARSSEALRAAAKQDSEFLHSTDQALGDLAATVQRRRSHHAHRLALIADRRDALSERLAAWSSDGESPEVIEGHSRTHTAGIVFVFSGQGSQWIGMGRDLVESVPMVRATMERYDELLRPAWGHSLLDLIRRSDDSIFRTDIGQPVIFALQVAIARLLEHWGLRPARVLGHSVGEVAAAHIAGALSDKAAAEIIIERSRAQERTRGPWRMVAVGLSESQAAPLIAPYGGAVQVAAINSPTQLTLAGERDAIEELSAKLSETGVFAHVLPLEYAFHTHAMEPVRQAFSTAIAGLSASECRIPFVSTVTGREEPGPALGPDYWWRNLREPVRFASAVEAAIQSGHRTFVEIGPSPSLVRYLRELIESSGVTGEAFGTLQREQPALRCLLSTLAELHVRGVGLDWKRVTPADCRHRSVPGYPWQHKQFWAEGQDARALRLGRSNHPLLGRREAGAALAWLADIGTATHSFLSDHRLDDRPVFPAAGYVELMLAAARKGEKDVPLELRDLSFERVLWLDATQLVQTSVDERGRTLSVSAREASGAGDWQRHGHAHFQVNQLAPDRAPLGLIPDDIRELDLEALYARFRRAGHGYGRMFRTLRWAGQAGTDLWGKLAAEPSGARDAGGWLLNPTILDGALQLTLASMPVDGDRDAMYLPVHIDRLEWARCAGDEVLCRVSNIHHQDVRSYADIELFTKNGDPVAALYGCCCIRKEQSFRLDSGPGTLYREEWIEAETAPESLAPVAESWTILDLVPGSALGQALAEAGFPVLSGSRAEGPWDTRRVVVLVAPDERREPSTETALTLHWPLLRVAQTLASRSQAGQLVVVTADGTWGHPGPGSDAVDPLQAMAGALLRTVATELARIECRLVDLERTTPETQVRQLLGELRDNRSEPEVAYRGASRFTQRVRMQPLKELARRPLTACRRGRARYHLMSALPGNLDQLQWQESALPPLAGNQVEIRVAAVGLNFRDVLKALDLYPLLPSEQRTFGDECTGIVSRVGTGVSGLAVGEQVVAIAPGCFGNLARTDGSLVCHKPDGLSFEQAATIPIAFLTADYALTEVARLQPGETVLIHAAAGGVGLAAVQIALRIGAIVLGTASPDKQDLLRSMGVKHVFHSRNLSFVEGVRQATGGEGVDVVLNSLSGEYLARSLQLLKPLGRFVEIGKKDIFSNESLDLESFRSAISFHAVDLARVIASRPAWIGSRLARLLERFDAGVYRPLPHLDFSANAVADAFRLMAQGKHRGKVLITFAQDRPPDSIRSADARAIRSEASYLVTGGLTGFGWATARWLVAQGAKTLVLASRSGATTPEVVATMEEWRVRGINVRVARCDVADAASVHALVDDMAREMPSIRGVFHSAMVLEDEPIDRISRESLSRVLAPKVQGAWNLHRATEPLDLDHFVLYSSCATLLGSAGQASYVAANRFLEALAAMRRARGLAALAVGWGPLADFGVVSERRALAHYLEEVGLGCLPGSQVFAWLDLLLRRDVDTAYVAQVDWARYGEANPRAAGSSRFAGLIQRPQSADASGELQRLLAAASPTERGGILEVHLRRMVASVLGAPEGTVDWDMSLADLGLDSLMAFELKIKIDAELRVDLPLNRLSADAGVAQLAEMLLTEWVHREPCRATPSATASAASTPPAGADAFFHLVTQATAKELERLPLDAAALTYLPDRLATVGGLSDEAIGRLFGIEPFVSNYFDTPFGRIGAVTLPVRSKGLFRGRQSIDLILRALALAQARGARCVSLTGLIPSATDHGRAIAAALEADRGPVLTTGHATTTAAVIRTLQNMVSITGRDLRSQRVAVLGLGSIGQSCVRLMLRVLPHPPELVLCDQFVKLDALEGFARTVRTDHGYQGRARVAPSAGVVPEEVYCADIILAAVSVPEILDVDRLRAGTLVVDDSYPPAFDLKVAIRRIEERADILFSNAGMLRLPSAFHETLVLPEGGDAEVEAFGVAAFREEMRRDPNELTACVLSSALTVSDPEFGPTLGLADPSALESHYHGLTRIGVGAARLQCGSYFVSDTVIRRFVERFGGHVDRSQEGGAENVPAH